MAEYYPGDRLLVAMMDNRVMDQLAGTMVLGALLEAVRNRWGEFELVDHWKQGEFHHDVVLRVADTKDELPGSVLVVSTNCNGGIKEVLALAELPERYGLWHHRCPDSEEFQGRSPKILASSRTYHWFDPCELLTEDARSELRAEYRVRQPGGGWMMKKD